MGITPRHRNRPAGDTGEREMDRARVRAPAAGLAILIGDFLRVRRLAQPADNARVGEGAPVQRVDRGSRAEFGVVADVFPPVMGGKIVGGGRIDGESLIRC